MRVNYPVYLILLCCFSLSLSAQSEAINSQANRVVEISFQAEKSRSNPFLEIEVDVVFTDPQGTQKTVPAFWAGGEDWKVRYASPILGTHSYRTQCSDTQDKGLHGIEGQVEVFPYYGENKLYRHGPIQVGPSQRHFEHADLRDHQSRRISAASVCLTCGKTLPRVAIWPKSIRRSFSVSRTGIPCGWNKWLDLSGRVEALNTSANKS